MTQHFETLVLDSQGVSAWVAQDRKILTMLQVFHSRGADPIISANTIVEVSHGRVSMPRLNWVLSRLKIEPVTGQTAKAAAELLKTAGLHGHKQRDRCHRRRDRTAPARSRRHADLGRR